MSLLYQKSWIEHNLSSLKPWKRKAFTSFTDMINDANNSYPCVLGRQGFNNNELRFCFANDPREAHTHKELAQSLKEYSKVSRSTGQYASLVLLFNTYDKDFSHYTVADYEQLFWKVLNGISANDEMEWPASIPEDPKHHKWEFCFHGEPYFAFCATPTHFTRASRYAPTFLIALQPRWVFENINDHTSFGRKIKHVIRKRLNAYDKIPIHPSLKWYGQEDNYEWQQYFLRDDDSIPSTCPFSKSQQNNENVKNS
ncbi:YqcI/YcgG family protein [Pontibacillus litoralis]|uniref:YqcI/YcgG family protein n=1 Tax=Pontibacillus litoralis JSM 072002 TaxID=1385512 RepID=A0A0A5G151_9BACI|nr:YqcI/YcgG family protein [Pontibacillus litoralis]KGX86831.1 hypothetical protein N784_02955 [Pontibacillus litoralis JSM 072002]